MSKIKFNQTIEEQKEADLLSGRGLKIRIKPLPFDLTVDWLPIGVMDRISAEMIQFKIDENLLNSKTIETIREAARISGQQAYTMAKIIAIALIGNSRYYDFLFRPVTAFVYNYADPRVMLQVTAFIAMQFDATDFHKLYRIEEAKNEKNKNGKMKGLRSTFGSRGSIMSHLHIPWDDLMWNVPWATIQRMLIDAPSYEPNNEENKPSGTNQGKKMSHDDLAAMLLGINEIPR